MQTKEAIRSLPRRWVGSGLSARLGMETLPWQSISLFPRPCQDSCKSCSSTAHHHLPLACAYVYNTRLDLPTQTISVLDFPAVCSFYKSDFRRIMIREHGNRFVMYVMCTRDVLRRQPHPGPSSAWGGLAGQAGGAWAAQRDSRAAPSAGVTIWYVLRPVETLQKSPWASKTPPGRERPTERAAYACYPS